jgi:ribosomal protein L11 methyltransferase
MPDPIIITIINSADDSDIEDSFPFHSPSLEHWPRPFDNEDLPSPASWNTSRHDGGEQDPLEFAGTERGPGGGHPLRVTIDTGYAFGDGRHATTWLCVRFLLEHLADISPERRRDIGLLDAGTGTGILAIIAERLGVGDIDAVDLFPHAILCAGRNRAMNGCEGIRLHESDLAGFNPGRSYDIVMANLVSDVIIANLENLARFTAPGGLIIASGISSGNDLKMRKHFAESGFTVTAALERDGWCGYLLRR